MTEGSTENGRLCPSPRWNAAASRVQPDQSLCLGSYRRCESQLNFSLQNHISCFYWNTLSSNFCLLVCFFFKQFSSNYLTKTYSSTSVPINIANGFSSSVKWTIRISQSRKIAKKTKWDNLNCATPQRWLAGVSVWPSCCVVICSWPRAVASSRWRRPTARRCKCRCRSPSASTSTAWWRCAALSTAVAWPPNTTSRSCAKCQTISVGFCWHFELHFVVEIVVFS